jgi:hypothetical protein
LDVDIDEDVIVVGESWATLNDLDWAGRAHVYTLGEIETKTPEVEETPTVTEEEPEVESTRWIPGFPVTALILGLLFAVIFFTQRKQ